MPLDVASERGVQTSDGATMTHVATGSGAAAGGQTLRLSRRSKRCDRRWCHGLTCKRTCRHHTWHHRTGVRTWRRAPYGVSTRSEGPGAPRTRVFVTCLQLWAMCTPTGPPPVSVYASPKTISAVLPEEYHTRPAYLKFKNLKTGLAYCQYGVVKEDGKPKDCKEVPPDAVTEEEKQQYRPQVLTSCVCTPGTECKSVIGNAGVASVASTIFVRIALGTLLERFGPVNVQCGLMSFGAFWVDLGIQLEIVFWFPCFSSMLHARGVGQRMFSAQARQWRPQSQHLGITP